MADKIAVVIAVGETVDMVGQLTCTKVESLDLDSPSSWTMIRGTSMPASATTAAVAVATTIGRTPGPWSNTQRRSAPHFTDRRIPPHSHLHGGIERGDTEEA